MPSVSYSPLSAKPHPQHQKFRSVLPLVKMASVALLSFMAGLMMGSFHGDSVKSSILSTLVNPRAKVNEFTSIEEGFRANPSEPFIVRSASDFVNFTTAHLQDKLDANQHWLVYGYDQDNNKIENVPLGPLVASWHTDQLDLTVFDSPLHIFDLPNSLSAVHSENQIDRAELGVALGQCIILSRKNSYTALHMDPVNYGGGWMVLFEGQKEWEFLNPVYAQELFDPTTRWLADMSPKEFLSLSYAVGYNDKFKATKAFPGDFIYFPPAWMHRVKTFDKALGIGGYIRPQNSLHQLALVEKHFDDYGIWEYWNEE